MKTIDCALAQDLMPLYTEGMLSPESREALEEHLAGCEACRRTADEMCHPLLEPQFQEEARLLRRLRRRRKALVGGGDRPGGAAGAVPAFCGTPKPVHRPSPDAPPDQAEHSRPGRPGELYG